MKCPKCINPETESRLVAARGWERREETDKPWTGGHEDVPPPPPETDRAEYSVSLRPPTALHTGLGPLSAQLLSLAANPQVLKGHSTRGVGVTGSGEPQVAGQAPPGRVPRLSGLWGRGAAPWGPGAALADHTGMGALRGQRGDGKAGGFDGPFQC